jgi:hypothetical protein
MKGEHYGRVSRSTEPPGDHGAEAAICLKSSAILSQYLAEKAALRLSKSCAHGLRPNESDGLDPTQVCTRFATD